MSFGQGADGLALLPRDTHRQELREPGSLTDHSQGPVLGIDQDDRGLDDPTQHLGQVEPSAHRHDGLQQQGRLGRTPLHGVQPILEIARQRAQPTVHLSAVVRYLVAHGASVVTRA